jgi:hypothetical protein
MFQINLQKKSIFLPAVAKLLCSFTSGVSLRETPRRDPKHPGWATLLRKGLAAKPPCFEQNAKKRLFFHFFSS